MSSFELKKIIRPGYFSKIARADELRCDYDSKNQTIIQKDINVDIVFIGDSIFQMWELQAYFHGSDLMVVNRGIGGDHTEYLLSRFEADAVQLKPKLCICLCGINDTWIMEDDDIRQVTGLPMHTVLQESLGNMEKIILKAEAAGMHLAVCSLLPTDLRCKTHEDDRKEFIQLFNQHIHLFCESKKVDFINLYPLFLSSDGKSIRKELTSDGIHPNVFGYDILYTEINKIIQKYV